MELCKRLILIATEENTPPERVTCSHSVGHSGSHLGTLIDGRQYEWTLPRGEAALGHFV